ncbi:hypothetical protein, partial [Streptomyces sp. NPDC057596]
MKRILKGASKYPISSITLDLRKTPITTIKAETIMLYTQYLIVLSPMLYSIFRTVFTLLKEFCCEENPNKAAAQEPGKFIKTRIKKDGRLSDPHLFT